MTIDKSKVYCCPYDDNMMCDMIDGCRDCKSFDPELFEKHEFQPIMKLKCLNPFCCNMKNNICQADNIHCTNIIKELKGKQ